MDDTVPVAILCIYLVIWGVLQKTDPQKTYFCHLGRNISAKGNIPIASGKQDSRRMTDKT